MSYYEAVRVLQANDWVSVKLYNNRETWTKKDNTFVLMVRDRISKNLINSVIASV